MIVRSPLRRALGLASLGLAATAAVPAAASAHSLTGRYESPLPLEAYLAGAALAVALSFAMVVLRNGTRNASAAAIATAAEGATTRSRAVPRWLAVGLRGLGLVAWLWIMAQAIVGSTNSDADVASLFLWTYGWVVLPIICALIGPAWDLIDPFRTLHDLGAAALRRLNVTGWRTAEYPAGLGHWPAVIGFFVFVWLELVLQVARAGRPLAMIAFAYTLFTLVMMAQFGRDTWRSRGETFTVWYHTVGRLAPFAWVSGEEGRRVRRRPFGAGLFEEGWDTARLVLVALATASILYDGLSQTQFWFDLVGVPPLAFATVHLVIFMGMIALAVLGVARIVGTSVMAAGIVPIALGYLIAHYLTAVFLDSQRLITAVSDPFQLGWNLLGTATYEPDDSWLPGAAVWAIQLVAVVGGHVLGAWFGHRAAVAEVTSQPAPARPRTAKKGAAARGARPVTATAPVAPAAVSEQALRDARRRQVPLAVLMVFLTALTLWSLGQGLVQHGGGVLG